MFDEEIVDVTDQAFTDKSEVTEYLANLLLKKNKISNSEEYVIALNAREQKMSTEIGHQIAVPHGESNCVNEVFVACLKLNSPVLWDKERVSLIFNIGVPLEKRNMDHIKILAQLSSCLMHEEFRERLYKATDRKELFKILREFEEEGKKV